MNQRKQLDELLALHTNQDNELKHFQKFTDKDQMTPPGLSLLDQTAHIYSNVSEHDNTMSCPSPTGCKVVRGLIKDTDALFGLVMSESENGCDPPDGWMSAGIST